MCKISIEYDTELEEANTHEARVITDHNGVKHRIIFLFTEDEIFCDNRHRIKLGDGDLLKEDYQTDVYSSILASIDCWGQEEDKEEIYRRFWENMTFYSGLAMKNAIDEALNLNALLDLPRRRFRVSAPEGYDNWTEWAKSGDDAEAKIIVDGLISQYGDNWQQHVSITNTLKDKEHSVYLRHLEKAYK